MMVSWSDRFIWPPTGGTTCRYKQTIGFCRLWNGQVEPKFQHWFLHKYTMTQQAKKTLLKVHYKTRKGLKRWEIGWLFLCVQDQGKPGETTPVLEPAVTVTGKPFVRTAQSLLSNRTLCLTSAWIGHSNFCLERSLLTRLTRLFISTRSATCGQSNETVRSADDPSCSDQKCRPFSRFCTL